MKTKQVVGTLEVCDPTPKFEKFADKHYPGQEKVKNQCGQAIYLTIKGYKLSSYKGVIGIGAWFEGIQL